MKRICVFCGSSPGVDPRHRQAARRLGQGLARRGLELVFGGGRVGLMGEVAEACLEAGGVVIGVIPQFLLDREVGHDGCSSLHVVDTMHARKALMADLSDAFLALPGGIGTMEELFEAWTWSQLGTHAKPVGLLDVAGYYGPLVAFLDHMVGEGFLAAPHRALLRVGAEPEEILDRLCAGAVVSGAGLLDDRLR